MSSEKQRRLAAIMFTDMVGYTALGQKNESLSLALVDEQRKLIRPVLGRHHGREVKTMGDAFLVEFQSALEAVRCSYDIQRATREFNISLPDERKVHLRIGIHLGDVVGSHGDISGDAVNLASRIEPLALDGGVCLTRQVYDQVENKLDLQIHSLGKKDLKNVASPIEVFRLVMPWENETVITGQEFQTRRIAVLPFVNMSLDPQDEFFADGLTEELIDRLCQVKELEVIARTSIMSYKKKEKKASEIGRELKAGALVEGSVRKAGNRIRVTAQLINANTEGHLWSSKYDRDLGDIFAVQTDIAERVATALEVQLLPSEKKAVQQKRTESMEAYTLYLKGRQLWNRRSKEAVEEALGFFKRACEIDPKFALSHVGISDCYAIIESWGYGQASENAPKAKQAVLTALGLDDGLAEAHASYACALADYEWNWKEAETEFKRAIELNPNYASAHQWYANDLLRFVRRVDEEMREVEKALELDPLAPMMSWNKGTSLFIQERYDEAIEWLDRVLALDPGFVGAYQFQADCHLMSGRQSKAIHLYESYMHRQGLPENRQKLIWVWIYGKVGREAEARRLLNEVTASSDKSIPPTSFANAYEGLGETEKMFEFLELALVERNRYLPWLLITPEFKQFRSDPRFQEVKRKVGI